MEISTTLGIVRNASSVFTPKSISELEGEYPRLKQHSKNISVISRGNNWGYGCHAPSLDGDLLIDLHLCNQIIEFDPYHGTVTLEPGVSFGQLAKHLKDHADEWMAPVHGGGPETSVMGNALERGYGLTPHTDHFGAVLSLRALLENGEIYESPMAALGLKRLAKLFRYGVGPYFDGIFTQSGIGIVTQITIRLAKKPNYAEMFYFSIQSENDLLKVIHAIKKSKRDLGSTLGGINLMNRERCLSMVADYPLNKIQQGLPLTEKELSEMAKKFLITPWLVVGMLYGQKTMVKAAKKHINNNFKSIAKRQFYFNTDNKKIFNLAGKILSSIGLNSLASSITTVSKAFELLQGTPSTVALRLAYWKNENRPPPGDSDLNPNRDGCGLIWYAPLVEMEEATVARYIAFIREASLKFNINSLITLTTIDDLCFDSTIPILFNRKNERDVENAKAYHEYLFREGRQKGFFPYRLNIETQKELHIQNPFLQISAINPSRYQ